MKEQEIVNCIYSSMYDIDELPHINYQRIAHSIFLNCIVRKDISPSVCAKFLCLRNSGMHRTIIDVLRVFPEFEEKVKKDLEKVLILL